MLQCITHFALVVYRCTIIASAPGAAMPLELDVFSAAERLMGMDDAVWRRHASTWSVVTRIPILPLLLMAVYARRWLGWGALIPVLVLVWWTYYNPRAFTPPRTFDGWAARATMGERLLLARNAGRVAVPRRHWHAAVVLTALSAAGLLPAVCGVLAYNPWMAAFGALLTVGAGVWFCDRMVWLCDDLNASMGVDFPFRHLLAATSAPAPLPPQQTTPAHAG